MIVGGAISPFASQEQPCQWLWVVTAEGMITTEAFLSIETLSCRGPVIDWRVGRKDIDYRVRELGLCMLAVLLLDALGWIGRN